MLRAFFLLRAESRLNVSRFDRLFVSFSTYSNGSYFR